MEQPVKVDDGSAEAVAAEQFDEDRVRDFVELCMDAFCAEVRILRARVAKLDVENEALRTQLVLLAHGTAGVQEKE